MMKLLWIFCGLFLNILGTDDNEVHKLVISINGITVKNGTITHNKEPFFFRYKNVTAGSPMNITCEIVGNNLEDPSLSLRRTSNHENTEKHACPSHPCKSISKQITPLPGSVVTCQTNSTNNMYKYSLVFLEKLPFVTVAINKKTLVVGPNQTELTYKFDRNESIVANCTHNTKMRSGVWNFSGLPRKEAVVKIDETAVNITLGNEMNNFYIDCEDRSTCDGGYCQPAYIRVKFVLKALRIINNNNSTTISNPNDTEYSILHYKENDILDLTCYKEANLYLLSWYKNGQNLTTATYDRSLSLKLDNPLRKEDNGTQFKCSLETELGNPKDFDDKEERYKIVIQLQYDNDHIISPQVISPPMQDSYVSDFSNKYLLIFGPFVLILTIIVILIILFICKSKKHKSEDKLRLNTVQMNDTYSNPLDTNKEPADNNIYDVDKAYSTPFSETKEVYALPVPKKFRTHTPKVVIDVKNKNQYYSYAKNIRHDYNRPYENTSRQYENTDGNGGQGLYSEINPY